MKFVSLWAIVGAFALSGCHFIYNTPSFDKIPGADETAPHPDSIVAHINCEMIRIVKGVEPGISPDEAKKLLAAETVASITLTLAVTDLQQFNPSLAIFTPFSGGATNGRTGNFGIQYNLEQDRQFNVNYAVDLEQLAEDPAPASKCAVYDGINGNLGLAEIVASGMHAIEAGQRYNIYGSAGAQLPPASIAISGSVANLPEHVNLPFKTLGDNLTFTAYISPSPPPADNIIPESIQMMGTLTDTVSGWSAIGSLTGTLLTTGDEQRIGVSGSITDDTGASYTLSLEGRLNSLRKKAGQTKKAVILEPNLTGKVTAQGKDGQTIVLSKVSPAQSSIPVPGPVPTPPLSTSAPAIPLATAGVPKPAGGAAPGTGGAANSSGTTSFGSSIDFVLTLGANGGLNLVTKSWRGPAASGSNPLLNFSRATTDTVTVTFVPTCSQSGPPINRAPADFWESLPACSLASKANSAFMGFSNNTGLQVNGNFNRLISP